MADLDNYQEQIDSLKNKLETEIERVDSNIADVAESNHSAFMELNDFLHSGNVGEVLTTTSLSEEDYHSIIEWKLPAHLKSKRGIWKNFRFVKADITGYNVYFDKSTGTDVPVTEVKTQTKYWIIPTPKGCNVYDKLKADEAAEIISDIKRTLNTTDTISNVTFFSTVQYMREIDFLQLSQEKDIIVEQDLNAYKN